MNLAKSNAMGFKLEVIRSAFPSSFCLIQFNSFGLVLIVLYVHSFSQQQATCFGFVEFESENAMRSALQVQALLSVCV